MKHSPYRSLAPFLLLSALAACEAQHVDAITESSSQPIVLDAPPDAGPIDGDPYGACELDLDTAVFPFRCNVPDTACTGFGTGTRVIGPETTSFVETYHVVCDHICETAADCPVPRTGNAEPVCLDSVHACELRCDDDLTCPDGYVCQDTGNWGLSNSYGNIPLPRICMQTFVIETAIAPPP